MIRDLANPGQKPDPLTMTTPSHPGWVYGLRFTADGKYLVSAGGAPQLRGYLAVWRVADGKLLWGSELAIGTIHGLAISPDGKRLAISTGASRPMPEANNCYILQMPDVVK